MQLRAFTIASAARRVGSPRRGPIGFAVRDATGRGCAFEIEESAHEALVFGSSSALQVTAPGVLPAHVVVLPHDGKLVAASASAASPALLNGAPLPTKWTVLTVPSRIRIGAAAIDFFFLRESGTVLIDQDVETTVADPGSNRLDTTHVERLPPHDARELLTYVKLQWTSATPSTRVLLGVVAILIVFLVGR
jgi:hypothetical protein